ncbi:MAG: hypothetical protein EA415_12230 [Sphaerobacteraceae bacterium]|nr:MAG: hypothetical protein EA415_12230 [Sphaerobacteraceae bacterium]
MRFLLPFTAIALAAILIAGWPMLDEAGTARSASEDTHAGMVISFGDDTTDFVLFELDPSETITAMELLLESDYDLEIAPFGGLGEAICSIDDTGCPGSDCFCESFSSPAYYWQFFKWDGQQWVPQHQGASQHEMEPGQILAWAWTAGDPELPEVSFEDFTAPASVDGAEEPTPVPTEIILSPDATVVADDLDDDASADDQESSGSGLQCLQFISILAIGTGVLGFVGKRRYGTRVAP